MPTAALFSSAPSCRKKGTSLSRCLLLAEMVGILPRAKQQPAGLIACDLRTAALFSSTPSCRKKGTSLSRCLLLAEMVGFEPTCPIKDKTISSRSRYDHFDTSPYSNHAVERSANITLPILQLCHYTKNPAFRQLVFIAEEGAHAAPTRPHYRNWSTGCGRSPTQISAGR